MNKNVQNMISPIPGRAISIDFFRGLTMFLLVGESTRLYSFFISPEINNSFIHFIGSQLHHHEWHGLNFWDLIQPFFMFIVKVSFVNEAAKTLIAVRWPAKPENSTRGSVLVFSRRQLITAL
jgi:predicted acyltransferase